MKEKIWHNIIKEKLQPIAMVPKADVWQNVQSAINKKRRKRFIAWLSGGAVVCLALGIVIGKYWTLPANNAVKLVNKETGLPGKVAMEPAVISKNSESYIFDNSEKNKSAVSIKNAVKRLRSIHTVNSNSEFGYSNLFEPDVNNNATKNLVVASNTKEQLNAELATENNKIVNEPIVENEQEVANKENVADTINKIAANIKDKKRGYYVQIGAGMVHSKLENTLNEPLLNRDKRVNSVKYNFGIGKNIGLWQVGIDYNFHKIGYQRLYNVFTESDGNMNFATTYTLEDTYVLKNATVGIELTSNQVIVPITSTQQLWNIKVARNFAVNTKWELQGLATCGLGFNTLQNETIPWQSPNNSIINVQPSSQNVQKYTSLVYGTGLNVNYKLSKSIHVGGGYSFSRQAALGGVKGHVFNWHGTAVNLMYLF